MNLKYRAARGVIWLAIQKGGNQLSALLIFLFLSRLLEPEAFGLVAMATVFTAFIQVFIDQGFSAALVQFDDIDPEHLDTAFWTSIAIGSILVVATISASNLLAAGFGEPRLAPIIRWLSINFLLGALSRTQQACLERELEFRALATRSLAASILGGVVGITAAFLGFGVWSLVIQSLAGGVAGTIVLWRASDWRPGFRFSFPHFKSLYAFGFHIIGNNLLNYVSRRSDDFLIGYFLGPVALGYYTVAYRLLLLMTDLFIRTISSVTLSTFSRLQNNPEQMRLAFYKATQFTSLIAFPAFTSMYILAPDLIPALFGEKWAPSIPVAQILSWIGILHAMIFFNTTVLVAAGKPSWRLAIMLLNQGVTIAAFFLVVRGGIVAVAAAYVVAGYLLSPVSLLAAHKIIKIDFRTYFQQYVPPAAGSLLLAFTILVFQNFLRDTLNPYLQLSAYLLAGGVVYFLAIQLINPSLSRQFLSLVLPSLPYPKRSS